jgi:hypothetical protein
MDEAAHPAKEKCQFEGLNRAHNSSASTPSSSLSIPHSRGGMSATPSCAFGAGQRTRQTGAPVPDKHEVTAPPNKMADRRWRG